MNIDANTIVISYLERMLSDLNLNESAAAQIKEKVGQIVKDNPGCEYLNDIGARLVGPYAIGYWYDHKANNRCICLMKIADEISPEVEIEYRDKFEAARKARSARSRQAHKNNETFDEPQLLKNEVVWNFPEGWVKFFADDRSKEPTETIWV